MSEQRNGSLSIPLALAIGLSSMLATAGVSWGVYSTRTEAMEGAQREQGTMLVTHDRQITEVRAQYTEIIRRLDQIDRKLERQP